MSLLKRENCLLQKWLIDPMKAKPIAKALPQECKRMKENPDRIIGT